MRKLINSKLQRSPQDKFFALAANVSNAGNAALNHPITNKRPKGSVEFSRMKAAFPAEVCIHQLVEQQAQDSPNAIAVLFGNEKLTYAELNAQANQLAHHLRELGVGPEVLVGIFMRPSLLMIVGLLGILKAGGAYVPLDPEYPADRLCGILEDTKTPIVLSESGFRKSLSDYDIRLVFLDEDWNEIQKQPETNPVGNIPEQLAYVIFTSGSTGRPKGVLVTHRNLFYSTFARRLYYDEGVKRFLLLSSYAFDSSVAGLFWSLCFGGTLVLPPTGWQRDPMSVIDIIHEKKVSHILCLPSLYNLVLAEGNTKKLGSLRCVIVAGEACPKSLVDIHKKLMPETALFNEYGPTEGTVWCTVFDCLSQNLDSQVPIGSPIANALVELLDEQLQPVADGELGELFLGGLGVARGYLNRPDLTAELFIPNPFDGEQGTRLYKTGDLARYRKDGSIDFLGRVDHQVKIRGYRVELEEIEAFLKHHPDLQEAVVTARPDKRSQENRLLAYVVPSHAKKTNVSELRSFLDARLPGYMVPSSFIYLEKLPCMPNGKVDREALPEPNSSRPDIKQTFVGPRNELEESLAKIWAETLGIERVGVYDNFFDLGGDSLLAVRLFIRIQKELNLNIPREVLFEAPTVADLTDMVRARDWSLSWSPLDPIQPNGSKTPFFCVSGALGGLLYFHDLSRHLGPDQPFYGLRPAGRDGIDAPLTRIEDMAASYIQELKGVQAQGPYFLGGHSFGCAVAFEMAQQLLKQGQEVALLVMLDFLVNSRQLWPQRTFRRVLNWHLQSLSMLDLMGKLRYIKNLSILQVIKSNFFKNVCKSCQTAGRPLPHFIRPFSIIRLVNYQAVQEYAPRPYPGQIVFFQGEEASLDPSLGLPGMAIGGLEIYRVSGGHDTMLYEPHVQVLAKKLKACIEQAGQHVAIPSRFYENS